jgi:uncharacterized protein (TIGR03382 family)
MNVGSVDVLEDFLVLQQEDGLLRVYDIAGGVEAPTLLGEGFAYYTRKTEVHGTVAHTPTANGLYLFSVPRSSQEPAGPVAMWYRVAQLPIGDDDDSADPGDDDSADPDDDDSADPGDDDSADPGDDDDSAASDDDVVDDDDSGGPGPTSCTCSSGPSAVGPLLMLPGLLAVRRRRRRPI